MRGLVMRSPFRSSASVVPWTRSLIEREGVVADPPPLDHLRNVGMAQGGEEVGVGRELGDGLSLGDVGGGLHDGDQNIPTVLFALPDV